MKTKIIAYPGGHGHGKYSLPRMFKLLCNCWECGKQFKNLHGVMIHYGKIHPVHFQVIPREPQDKKKAKIMAKLLDYQWKQSKTKIQRAVLNGILYGKQESIKVWWDKDLKDTNLPQSGAG